MEAARESLPDRGYRQGYDPDLDLDEWSEGESRREPLQGRAETDPTPGALPGGRAHEPLRVVANRFRPVTLATEQVVPVLGPLGEMLPEGGMRRGTVLTIDGAPGTGATSLLLDLAAAVTAVGEWVAVVEPERSNTTIAAPAAVEAGVVLDRLVVVRDVPSERWGVVVGALVEGVTLVAAHLPPRVRLADARRIAAHVRERGSVFVGVGTGTAHWPERAAARLQARGGAWHLGGGRIVGRDLAVEVESKGRPVRHERPA